MFPPTKADTAQEVISGVLGSLSRGGGTFKQDVLVDPVDQDLVVTVGFLDAMPPAAERPMKQFLRAYARATGWRARHIKVHKNYFRFELSKAP